jgi:hypothetical protein
MLERSGSLEPCAARHHRLNETARDRSRTLDVAWQAHVVGHVVMGYALIAICCASLSILLPVHAGVQNRLMWVGTPGIFDVGVGKPNLFDGSFILDAWALMFVAFVLGWSMIAGGAGRTRPRTGARIASV